MSIGRWMDKKAVVHIHTGILKKGKGKSFSHVWLFATPWTVANQAPLSRGFSRQEYWSGLPFPSPGDLPNPGIEPGSPALQAEALPSEPPGLNPSPKVTNIPQDQISTPLLWNIWSVASYWFVLKPLINSYNQDHAPCRQHRSTLLIIKILLMPLTGPETHSFVIQFSSVQSLSRV